MTLRAFRRVESSESVVTMALAFGRLRYDTSTREEGILALIMRGVRSREVIAERLGVAENTLKTHIRRLLVRTKHEDLDGLVIELLRDSRSL